MDPALSQQARIRRTIARSAGRDGRRRLYFGGQRKRASAAWLLDAQSAGRRVDREILPVRFRNPGTARAIRAAYDLAGAGPGAPAAVLRDRAGAAAPAGADLGGALPA